MKLFNKVAIVGTGLIGGSIALDIKKRRLANTVVGTSRHKHNLLLAKQSGAIDMGSLDISIIKNADLVILATPIKTILALSPRIAKLIGSHCIVTDVGSTKNEIVASLTKIFPRFVGSHPLAGSEKRGIMNATVGMFKNSHCIVTPLKETDPQALKKIKKLWESLGSKVILQDPKTHDTLLSYLSHLPHIVAFSLITTIPDAALKFAPSSLKDTTRIAASDSTLWADIFLSNRKDILKSIKLFEGNLKRLYAAIKKNNKTRLANLLEHARQKRGSLR